MTMVEVAQLAGVSQSTVSRVISGHTSVSKQTVQVVRQAMRQVGYRPPRRRAIRRSHTSVMTSNTTIALLVLDDSLNEHPSMSMAKLSGVQTAATKSKLNLVMAQVGGEQSLPPVLMSKQLSGVLLWGRFLPPWVAAAIDDIPSVWLSSHGEVGGNCVLEGNAEVGSIAFDYLRRNGATSFAFVCPTRRFTRMVLSGNVFATLADGAGMPVHLLIDSDEDSERLGDYREAINRLIDRMLEISPRPNGLFVPDDRFAPMAYQRLRERGVEPGREVRVISCNNERSYLEALSPRPATIDLAPDLTGRLAVDHLLLQIRGGSHERAVGVVVQPKLVEGDSI